MDWLRKNSDIAFIGICILGMLGAGSVFSHGWRKPEIIFDTLSVYANVPPGTGPVYITGNIPELANWDAGGFPMEGTGTQRHIDINVRRGTEVEFKLTLGDWDHEALTTDGSIFLDTTVNVDRDTSVTLEVSGFGSNSAAPAPPGEPEPPTSS